MMGIENIMKNPTDVKKRKINSANKAYKKRIGGVVGGPYMMQALGFKKDDQGFLVMGKEVDLAVLQECLDLIKSEVKVK